MRPAELGSIDRRAASVKMQAMTSYLLSKQESESQYKAGQSQMLRDCMCVPLPRANLSPLILHLSQ